MKKLFTYLTMVFILLSLVSCGPQDKASKQDEGAGPAEKYTDIKGNKPKKEQKHIDYSIVKPNELGQVMILMYHDIGDKESEWVRTPDNFRKDLKTLYDKKFRLISLNNFLDGNIKTAAGYTPVVITFDDGDLGQFKVKMAGGKPQPDPDTAVGILIDFCKEHPDFGSCATFYIYHPLPFREKEYIDYKLKFLVDNGFEIGNHTDTHSSLSKLDGNGIEKELGLNVWHTQRYLPGYKVNTLALPYGSVANEYTKYLLDGRYEDTVYHNKAVLLVGANPAKSPYDAEFDNIKLPRIRASEMDVEGFGLYDWIKYFNKHPDKRYISDGDPDTIVIRKGMEDNIRKGEFGNKKIISY